MEYKILSEYIEEIDTVLGLEKGTVHCVRETSTKYETICAVNLELDRVGGCATL